MASINVYSLSGSSGSVNDHQMNHDDTANMSWSTLRGSANYANAISTSVETRLERNEKNSDWDYLSRVAISFNLRNVVGTVTASTFYFYVNNKYTPSSDPYFIIAEWNMTNGSNSAGTVDWNDYSTAWHSGTTIGGGITANAWNSLSIPASYVNAKVGSEFGLMLMIGADYNNSEPSWPTRTSAFVSIDATDIGTTNRPYIQLTYTPGTTGAPIVMLM
jgi:hypothetical protein